MSATMKYFNSNETLEMCDVRISENGTIEVATKSYHSEELQAGICARKKAIPTAML